VRGEVGFENDFGERDDPAIAVFWNTAEALGLTIEALTGETDQEEDWD